MNVRKKIETQIKKKKQEIQCLEAELVEIGAQIREIQAYINGMEDMMKHLPQDESGEESEIIIRPGSKVEATREYLRSAGEPKYIGNIIEGCGEEPTLKRRQALSGQLSAYVRKNSVFTRPAPNTFGLKEWDENKNTNVAQQESDTIDLPDGFGGLE